MSIADKAPLTILVIDDSALVRQVMTLLLSKAGMQVIVASDPIIAMEKMKISKPDVIILDLEMPKMTGFTFLRKIMLKDPIPVIICSALNVGNREDIIKALLEEGATEVIAKPKIGIQSFLEESEAILLDAIEAATQARRGHRKKLHSNLEKPNKINKKLHLTKSLTIDKIIAIGASTGGPEALRIVLESMPADSPTIVIVQHMPEKITATFAERLNQTCQIQVKEAVNGDLLLRGQALIAPGNYHMIVHSSSLGYFVEISKGELVSRHRPSVDVLFRSVAKSAKNKSIGVLMTGMGRDGAEGLLEMRRAGAITIAQNEASCVVFGMPKEAISLGAVDEICHLNKISETILNKLTIQK
ncbi:MAG: chemotaxis response regulator protein-glutamate methylesterase [Acidobacteria bacterium]|nr:chemotaxis response regulator protein-glutamate methylesterase [Acidobacteriota bacterium]